MSRKGVTLILEDVVACVPPLKLSEITEVIADYEADFPYDESSHTSTVCPEGIETTERGFKPQMIGELKAFALRNLKGLITAGNNLCAISAGREFGKIPPNSERQDAVVLGAILCLTNPEGFDVLIKLLPREEAKVRVAKNIVSVEGYPDIAPEIITRAKEYIVKHSPPLSCTRTVAPPT